MAMKIKQDLASGSSGHNSEMRVWRVLYLMAWGGLGMLLVLSVFEVTFGTGSTFLSNLRAFISAFGTCLLIGGACYGLGLFAGFLFGIPKAIQQPATLPNGIRKETYAHNDNLAQISDWLTKIIVGVGLTQLYHIPGFIRGIGEFLQGSFPGHLIGDTDNLAKHSVARNGAIGTVLYFSVVGFLTSYLWTSLYFTRLLSGRKGEDEEVPNPLDRRLLTRITENAPDAALPFRVSILVYSVNDEQPLTGDVVFTFPGEPGQERVPAIGNHAELLRDVSGPMLVAIEADGGSTHLVADLGKALSAPDRFRVLPERQRS